MAKKKTDLREEEEVKQPDEMSYEELHNIDYKQIAAKGELDKLEAEEEPVEEEIEYEEPVEETPKPTKTPKLTRNDVKAEVETAVKEALEADRREREEKALEAEKREKIEAGKSHTPKWVEENRVPKSYEEIYEETKKASIDEFEARMAERDEARRLAEKEDQERKAKIEADNGRYNEDLNHRLELDMNELYNEGKLPRIKDENDPDDEGVKARNELFQTGIETNRQRVAKGLPPVSDIKRIFYENYEPDDEQPAGEDAPIMGNRPDSTSYEDDNKISYQDLHKKSYREILQEAINRARGK